MNTGELTGVGSLALSRATDPAALRVACQDFEAAFVHLLLKEMYRPADGGSPRRELYLPELAGHIARSGGIGLADMLMRHLAVVDGGEPELPVEQVTDIDQQDGGGSFGQQGNSEVPASPVPVSAR